MGLTMKAPTLLSLAIPSLFLAVGCVAEDVGEEDGEDDIGVDAGKADGSGFSACELDKVVEDLNAGVTQDGLMASGLKARPARNLVNHRNGPDKAFGTADDNLFDDIDEVDAVSYVGAATFRALVSRVADLCVEELDIFAAARDVNLHRLTFPASAAAPAEYTYPDTSGFDLNGTEFWQKWAGGHNPTYSYEDGTEAGKRCMQASAIRFETIMKDPPAELIDLRDTSNWDGSFFNWNDDYSEPNARGSASGATLWAWRTYLIKWISQTGKDGVCYLPTLDLVKEAARECKRTATGANGEIQGCST